MTTLSLLVCLEDGDVLSRMVESVRNAIAHDYIKSRFKGGVKGFGKLVNATSLSAGTLNAFSGTYSKFRDKSFLGYDYLVI